MVNDDGNFRLRKVTLQTACKREKTKNYDKTGR